MSASKFGRIKRSVFSKLKGLDPHLTYHCSEHTADVLEQTIRIADEEGVKNEHEVFLLAVAALYHDTGFLRTYAEHEKKSCEIFHEDADSLGFSDADKALVESLIMVTRVPQTPETLLEKIICDADLDYLGRDDFFTIADSLRREFLWFKIITDDEHWEQLQFSFLEKHKYHTRSSQNERANTKRENYNKLMMMHAKR